MITVHLLRHAEPDYAILVSDDRRFAGNRRDFAPLSRDGRETAASVAAALGATTDAQLVVSSPYTRALETAAHVAAATGAPLRVIPQLHDWLAVIHGGAPIDAERVDLSIAEYLAGEHADATFETPDQVGRRVEAVVSDLASKGWREVVLVAHQEPLCRFAGIQELGMGKYVTRVFDPQRREEDA